VQASPELVAKLGHDYTVYAFDYSEYETPLVGQGMLSWLLASNSITPSAPAEQSQTMVTGRVCKNILGLFSNGIKETLEVKLKLVPVPTCMQSEYVENMERYHSLSQVMPEGLDYNAWADFLKANPAIRQLAQPTQPHHSQVSVRRQSGGVDSFHDMLTHPSPREDAMRFDSFQDHHMAFSAYDTRASSPAISTASYNPYQHHRNPPRPSSQASFHSESAAHSLHYMPSANLDQDEQEEEPPKKRARVTKAKRPKKATALGVNHDSLRVTASSAASVRNHGPLTANTGAAVSMEQIPRAPTPRPRNSGMPFSRGPLRPPAPSLLRNASVENVRPYTSPYDSGNFSDNAMESADEGRARSPLETPAHMPSSPPVMPRCRTSPARSSPELPSLPPPNDSGFVSDQPTGRDEEEVNTQEQTWEGNEMPAASEPKQRRTANNSNRAWTEFVPPPQEYGRSKLVSTDQKRRDATALGLNLPAGENFMESFHQQMVAANGSTTLPVPSEDGRQQVDYHRHYSESLLPSTERGHFDQMVQYPFPSAHTNGSPENEFTIPAITGVVSSYADKPMALNAPPNLPTSSTRAKGLPRSHTWSGGEPMSDCAFPTSDGATQQPRSGSGAKRHKSIRGKLEAALNNGQMPTYCGNCGQIDTPTWRRAFMRIENGVPEDIELCSRGTGITAYEIVEPEGDGDAAPKYRIFKQSLTEAEWETFKIASADKENPNTDPMAFTALTLCNPCGLWLNKRNAMRPHRVWAKAQNASERTKRKRPRRANPSKGQKSENNMSDAIVPDSEANIPEARDESEAPPSLDGTIDEESEPTVLTRSWSARPGLKRNLGDAAAQAGLLRAIQSSPVGLRGSKDSPIDLEADLTPKPTRRLLFPSPCQYGETKSLTDECSPCSPTTQASAPEMSKLEPQKPELVVEDTNKENCPPMARDHNDELAHLFEDRHSPKATPTKVRSLDDLLKTPKPGPRRIPLTPQRGNDNAEFTTPTRMMRTPRAGGRAPETPFTRQLNDLLSDCMASSPSQAMDFSAFMTFNTPGRNINEHGTFPDLLTGDFSSDFPIPSSPPAALGFSVFEDPNTSTVGLWSGTSIFDGNDVIMSEAHNAENDEHVHMADLNMHKMHGISADFEALIAQVAGGSNNDVAEQTLSVDAQNPSTQPESVPTTDPDNVIEPPNETTNTGLSDAVVALSVDGKVVEGQGQSAPTESTRVVEASSTQLEG
jgi:hypothetical protein